MCAAVKNGHIKAVQVLLSNWKSNEPRLPGCPDRANFYLNQACHKEKTPLYIAAENHQTELVKFLLSCRAKTNITCNGKTALQIAEELGHREIVELIKDHQRIWECNSSRSRFYPL